MTTHKKFIAKHIQNCEIYLKAISASDTYREDAEAVRKELLAVQELVAQFDER